MTIDKLATYNYLNGFILTEKGTGGSNVLPVVNAGPDQTITLPATLQLSGSATDGDGTIASYSWSKITGPAQFTFSSTSIANPTVSNLAQGTYTFRLTATDNKGGASTDDINVVVNSSTTPPVTTSKLVKVNLYNGSNAYSNSEWNNWNTTSTLSSGNLKYNDGTASTVNAAISQNGVSDNGASYASTMAPAEVIRYASYSTSSRTLTITGLDDTKTYDLELYASRSGATNNTTRFTIGSTALDVKTDNNQSNKAAFTALVSNGGKITIAIDRLNTYNYLNGFVLTENSASGTTAAKSVAGAETVSSSFDVFPNPVEDRFVLQVNNTYTGQMKVQVVDVSGVVQKEFTLAKEPGGFNANLSFNW